MGGVVGRWREIVGDQLAEHCEVETFDDAELVLRADSTAWATQLRLLAPTVVRRLNEELGHGTVVHLQVLGPHGPSWKKGRLSVRDGRGPRGPSTTPATEIGQRAHHAAGGGQRGAKRRAPVSRPT